MDPSAIILKYFDGIVTLVLFHNIAIGGHNSHVNQLVEGPVALALAIEDEVAM